jgi:hypothetical protein
MNENAYRARAERGEVQIGVRQMIALGATIINYSSDAAVLRAGYASVADEIRRAPAPRA